MNRPAPMKGKGKRKTDRQIWLMKYERDSKKIERDFSLVHDEIEIDSFSVSEQNFRKTPDKKVEFLHCKKNKKEMKKYSFKTFFLAIIFFFSKLVKASWFFRKLLFFNYW